jgi:hypothetical protein
MLACRILAGRALRAGWSVVRGPSTTRGSVRVHRPARAEPPPPRGTAAKCGAPFAGREHSSRGARPPRGPCSLARVIDAEMARVVIATSARGVSGAETCASGTMPDAARARQVASGSPASAPSMPTPEAVASRAGVCRSAGMRPPGERLRGGAGMHGAAQPRAVARGRRHQIGAPGGRFGQDGRLEVADPLDTVDAGGPGARREQVERARARGPTRRSVDPSVSGTR